MWQGSLEARRLSSILALVNETLRNWWVIKHLAKYRSLFKTYRLLKSCCSVYRWIDVTANIVNTENLKLDKVAIVKLALPLLVILWLTRPFFIIGKEILICLLKWHGLEELWDKLLAINSVLLGILHSVSVELLKGVQELS